MNSIVFKINGIIAVCIIVVAVSIGLYSLNTASEIILNDSIEKALFLSKNVALELDKQLVQVETIAISIGTNLGLHMNKTAYHNDITFKEDYLSSVEVLITEYLGVSNAVRCINVLLYPFESEKMQYRYGFLNDQGVTIINYKLDEDALKMMMETSNYNSVEKHFVGQWSVIYQDNTLDQNIISFVYPVYSEDEVMALVGVCLDNDIITKTVNEVRFLDSGYASLIDDNLNFLIHPVIPQGTNIGNIGVVETEALVDLVSSEDTGTFLYTYNDQKKFLGFSSLENGWKLSVLTDIDDIYSDLYKLRVSILVIVIFLILIALLIGYFLARSITLPLKKLISLTGEIRSGSYDFDEQETSNNEVGYLLKSFYDMSRDIKYSREQLEYKATHDPLTKLYNRRVVEELLFNLIQDSKKKDSFNGIMIVDLDKFKAINDVYGHSLGDQVLIHVAEMMQHATSSSDDICRLGGDEFLIIFRDIPTQTHVVGLADRVYNAIETPLVYEHDKSIVIGCSIGIALIDENILEPSELLNMADKAMYKAKENQHKYYMSNEI